MVMRVFVGNTPVTKEIADPKRGQLAYNMFYGMAEAGVLLNDNAFKREDLRILDHEGREVEPELDKEWFGTKEDNLAAQEAALEEEIKILIQETGMDISEIDREEKREMLDVYTVSWRDVDSAGVYPLPECWDIEKAQAMYAVMEEDLDDAAVLSIDTEYDGLVTLTHRDANGDNRFEVTNAYGDVYDCAMLSHADEYADDEDLGEGETIEEGEDYTDDFADALAALQDNGRRLEV